MVRRPGEEEDEGSGEEIEMPRRFDGGGRRIGGGWDGGEGEGEGGREREGERERRIVERLVRGVEDVLRGRGGWRDVVRGVLGEVGGVVGAGR